MTDPRSAGQERRITILSRRLLGRCLLIVIGLLYTAAWAVAAEKVHLRRSPEILQKLQQPGALRAQESLSLREAFGLSPDADLGLLQQHSDPKGLTYARYRQLYRGIPVWGEGIAVTRNTQNAVVKLHGVVVTDIEQDVSDVTPATTAQEALAAMQDIHQRRFAAAQGVAEEQAAEAELLYRNPTSELVIFVHQGKARLSYVVTFVADVQGGGHPTRPTFIVDAHSQEILYEFDSLAHAQGKGPGGNQKTGRYTYGKNYESFEVSTSGQTCIMDIAKVKAVNLNHKESGNAPHTFRCPRNSSDRINGAFSPINDGYFFGGVVYDMYQDWYGTDPLPFQIVIKAHYGQQQDNAFWDGSAVHLGDGATMFYPLAALDVVGHEVSHGFTEFNSGLTYAGQSGGINEAFSDMAGEAVEFYRRGHNDWLVGAEIFKGNGALRYMANPTRDGQSIDNANDYQAGMNVHFSSGVYNKAFYLLATASGWDTRKAFDVFVKANQDYWTPSTDFVDGAHGVRDAASDLGYSTDDVEAAFAAVGIDIGDTGPGGNDPCTACTHYTGTIAGSGADDIQPDGTYYFRDAGLHEGWLKGPNGTDFDLTLYKWDGSQWVKVAESNSATSSEAIRYSDRSGGYFTWQIFSYSGSGSYDFWLK